MLGNLGIDDEDMYKFFVMPRAEHELHTGESKTIGAVDNVQVKYLSHCIIFFMTVGSTPTVR